MKEHRDSNSEHGCRSASLPTNEVKKIMAYDNSSNFAISVSSDPRRKTITILRGDGTTFSVPFSSFQVMPMDPQPDFSKVSILDDGQSIKFGGYITSIESIIHDFNRMVVNVASEEQERLMQDWYNHTGWEFIGKDRVSADNPKGFLEEWRANVKWVEDNLLEADAIIKKYRDANG